jgi:hypothetical protein
MVWIPFLKRTIFFFYRYQSYHFIFWQIGEWNILVLDFRWILEIGIDQILDVTVVKKIISHDFVILVFYNPTTMIGR